jgi:hypothetical protein
MSLMSREKNNSVPATPALRTSGSGGVGTPVAELVDRHGPDGLHSSMVLEDGTTRRRSSVGEGFKSNRG